MRTVAVAALLLAPAIAHGAAGNQLANVWSPEPGWQIIGDRPGSPDVMVVGIFGQAYVPGLHQPAGRTPTRPSRAAMTRRLGTANAPRLVLTCEDGATAVTLRRPVPSMARSTYRATTDQRRRQSAGLADGSGVVVLQLDDGEPMEIDLRDYPRPTDPVYLSDPFDTIQALQRGETLYYWQISAGQFVGFDWDAGGQPPDAVFPLEGLRELLATTRDPCRWAAD